MVVLEIAASGGAVLRGRNENERIEVLWWPCSGRSILRAAYEGVPRKWVEECARFADDEFTTNQ